MQGPDRYRQRADVYPSSRTPRRDDNPEDWPNTQFSSELEGAAAAAAAEPSMYSPITHPNDWGLLRAPRIRPVPLPGGGEDRDHLLYVRLDLGGWLHSTSDGAPETMTCLDVTLSVPFSMDN
jgi:hypothetical protein